MRVLGCGVIFIDGTDDGSPVSVQWMASTGRVTAYSNNGVIIIVLLLFGVIVCVCVYICVCVCVCLCICAYMCVCVCVYVYEINMLSSLFIRLIFIIHTLLSYSLYLQ